MKKIITALANPELNMNLRKIKEFEIMADDIQYQDGILEILEEKNVDILILSELLKGEYNLKELIKKIKQKNPNIKIIILLEKENPEKIKIAKEEKADKIFFHHKVSVDEMIFYLKQISLSTNIEEEIENLKKIILENKTQIKSKENLIKKIKARINYKLNKQQTVENTNKKIITIAGAHGTGKSLISTCLALDLKKEKQKILLLDLDLLNQSINTIFGKKIIPKKLSRKLKKDYQYEVKNYHEFIIKINSHLDFICGKNILLPKEKLNIQKLNNFLEKTKKEYDLILVDISSECFLDYTKLVLQKSDLVLFLTEGNLLEIKKSIHLLDIYLKEWNIKKEKINIVFNKYNKNSIDEKILKNIFIDFNILGKISFNKNYALMINKNMKNYFFSKKEKREYEKILNNILLRKHLKANKTFLGGKLLWKN